MLDTVKSVTPLNYGAWEEMLVGYCESDYVLEGIRSGFSLEITKTDAVRCARASKGSPLLLEKINVEIDAGRVLGPFTTKPLADLHTSPVKVIAKKTPGKFRFIHNLSFPFWGVGERCN